MHTLDDTLGKHLFQSTLPLRGATVTAAPRMKPVQISIHTPLAGSDEAGRRVWRGVGLISIHTPLAGSDFRHCFLLA